MKYLYQKPVRFLDLISLALSLNHCNQEVVTQGVNPVSSKNFLIRNGLEYENNFPCSQIDSTPVSETLPASPNT